MTLTYPFLPCNFWMGISSNITPQSDGRTLLYRNRPTWFYSLYCCRRCNRAVSRKARI